ncbi:MAG: hypothetical protein EA377_03430 [Phycisphaerales bacterium]|nr:MAG: hypothetical protein EA377_03430 [Phycisphaerales bacterium]
MHVHMALSHAHIGISHPNSVIWRDGTSAMRSTNLSEKATNGDGNGAKIRRVPPRVRGQNVIWTAGTLTGRLAHGTTSAGQGSYGQCL